MGGRIEGQVVQISDSGDLVTDISAAQLEPAPRGEETRITCDEHQTLGIFPADHSEPEATFVALIGLGGMLQLTIVGMPTSEMLGIREGTPVVVEW